MRNFSNEGGRSVHLNGNGDTYGLVVILVSSDKHQFSDIFHLLLFLILFDLPQSNYNQFLKVESSSSSFSSKEKKRNHTIEFGILSPPSSSMF